eukprot:TRINITY_DN14142_c0_g1_i1.p1 TRINITY_DN14142_c0_g1~~TRINITY_DN14142_c0_g1_i1.p1  ORF type:complete len:313 (-),score=84.50 TRINITY_DN14142_c0_g1_i1:228-1166(-)
MSQAIRETRAAKKRRKSTALKPRPENEAHLRETASEAEPATLKRQITEAATRKAAEQQGPVLLAKACAPHATEGSQEHRPTKYHTKAKPPKRPARPSGPVMQPAGTAWTAQDRAALQKAYVHVSPSHPSFWRAVARAVGKPAGECAAEWQLLHKKPSRSRAAPARAGQDMAAQDMVVARKGTLTHKRQVRSLVQHVNAGHTDELFGQAASAVGSSSEEEEEELPQVFAAAEESGEEEEKRRSPGLLRRLDHDGFDTYIHRFKAKGKRAGTKPTGTAKRTALAMCLPDLRKEHDAGDDDEEEQEEEGEYYWSE